MQEDKEEIRDLRERNWSWMNNEILKYTKEIGFIGISVYFVLCKYANNNTQICWPSQIKIASELGVMQCTISKVIKKLESFNIIKVEKKRNKNAKWENSIYTFYNPSSWKPLTDTIYLKDDK